MTPYDGKIGLWHWKGSAIQSASVQDLADTLKENVPQATMVLVKVADGAKWQGVYDSSDLAIDGPDSIRQWVETLEQNGLEFHAWCVAKGEDVEAEAAIIAEACQQTGVRSLILDVEPYNGYWEGGPEEIQALMTALRAELSDDFHIGIAVDPRSQHYASIYPDEWLPFINSVHLMAYWNTFQRDAEAVIDEAFDTWCGCGLPLYPILPGNATAADMEAARERCITVQGAQGVTWWRLGVIAHWEPINVAVEAQVAAQVAAQEAEEAEEQEEQPEAADTSTEEAETETDVETEVSSTADGFDAPVGTDEERASADIWPGDWFDATGFKTLYQNDTAYHTGVDLNLNKPVWDSDAHSPVYAAASGVVTYADRLPGWGNVIVIKHDPLASTGQVAYARYAHVEDMQVQAGQRVARGEQIGNIGNAYGIFPYHLHYDISPTDILLTVPGHWPRLDMTNLEANYVDPLQFTANNRPTAADDDAADVVGEE